MGGMGDPLFNEDEQVEGISAEDQREIMLEIEKVAGENRIAVSDGLFDFKARKNGALFPIAVNLVGILLLAGGIASLLWIFRSGEQELLERGRAVVAAESRLIEEIRRETEAQLAEKDGEIASIQSRLQEIDAERTALIGNIEAELAQRETALRQELDAELEAERERLRALNLTEEEIELRLASFAEVKEREFSQRLDQFVRQAEAEQERLAQELNAREAEFNQSLAQANQERETLMQESAERLSALQEEYEAELAAGQAELDETQAELARLGREQERESMLRGQIRGLYQTASTALRQGNHDLARNRLRDLRSLLNEDAVLRVPALRDQRPVDLILIDSLESLIRFDERFGSEEAERRLAQGTLVARVQELVDQATAAAQEGRTEQAVSLYRQALDVIPEVSESYGFLGDADDESAAAELTRINEEAGALLQEADQARLAGNFRAAMDGYAAVVREYPRSRYRLDAITGMDETLAAVQSRGVALQDSLTDEIARLNAENEATIEALEAERAEAIASLETEREETIAQLEAEHAETIARLEAERAETIARLEAERAETIARLEAERAASSTELEAQRAAAIEALQEELSQLRLELASRETDLMEAQTEASQQVEQIATLQEQIALLREQAPEAEASLTILQTDLAAARQQLEASTLRIQELEESIAERDATAEEKELELITLQEDLAEARSLIGTVISPEVQAELDRLEAIEDELAQVRDQWSSYRRQSSVAGTSPDRLSDAQLLSARTALVRFLQDSTMARYFPALSDEIERFDSAFIASGRENALLDAADLLLDISFADSTSERVSLIRSARSGASTAYREFLNELEAVIESME